MVCEYVNQCCYERRDKSIICQNELLSPNCDKYQYFKRLEGSNLEEEVQSYNLIELNLRRFK